MDDGIIIKKMSSEYIGSYGRCVDSVARERKYLAAVEGFPPERTKEFVKKILDFDLPQYIAVRGDEVIGWCDILPKEFEGLSHAGRLGMGIKKEYRGRGIGSSLIGKTIEHAKRNGLEKIELEVFESNKDAIRLYKKYGFFKEGRLKKSRKIDGRYDNVILMGKFLK